MRTIKLLKKKKKGGMFAFGKASEKNLTVNSSSGATLANICRMNGFLWRM